jgi:hypothetical protein
VLPEPVLPGDVARDVGAVVVEQVGLDVLLAGPAEEGELVGPQIRVVVLRVRAGSDVALPGPGTKRRQCDHGHNRHISIVYGMTGVMSTGRRNVVVTEGTQQAGSGSTAVRGFRVGFPEVELTELRRRVNAAR